MSKSEQGKREFEKKILKEVWKGYNYEDEMIEVEVGKKKTREAISLTKKEILNKVNELLKVEIEKGCGKRIRYQDINLKCGEGVGDIGIIIPVYCKDCQNLINRLNKIIGEEELKKQIEEKKDEL